MASEPKQDLLKRIPPITDLLKGPKVLGWLTTHPVSLVTDCLRGATASVRAELLADSAGRCGPEHVTTEAVLARAAALLAQATTPHLRLLILASQRPGVARVTVTTAEDVADYRQLASAANWPGLSRRAT